MVKKFLKKKKGMETEMMGWWIIGIAVLVIMIGGYFILREKGIDVIEYLKNLLRFGR